LRAHPAASAAKRRKLLEGFLQRCRGGIDCGLLLETEFGPNVALLIPRILSWMQRSSQAKDNSRFFALSEQVATLLVFFSAANWHAYYDEFRHADGLAVLLRVLSAVGSGEAPSNEKVSLSTREALVRILLQISRHDRQSKEEVSRLGGEMVVILGPLALALVQSAPSMEVLCRELLVEQFVGNANNIPTTHGALRFMLDAANTRLRLFGAQVRRSVL
jgi:hypothetical protein